MEGETLELGEREAEGLSEPLGLTEGEAEDEEEAEGLREALGESD